MRADSDAMESRNRSWEAMSQVTSVLAQRRGVALDGGERRAQLVVEPGQELALQALGAPQRRRLGVGALEGLALEGQAERPGRVVEQVEGVVRQAGAVGPPRRDDRPPRRRGDRHGQHVQADRPGPVEAGRRAQDLLGGGLLVGARAFERGRAQRAGGEVGRLAVRHGAGRWRRRRDPGTGPGGPRPSRPPRGPARPACRAPPEGSRASGCAASRRRGAARARSRRRPGSRRGGPARAGRPGAGRPCRRSRRWCRAPRGNRRSAPTRSCAGHRR